MMLPLTACLLGLGLGLGLLGGHGALAQPPPDDGYNPNAVYPDQWPPAGAQQAIPPPPARAPPCPDYSLFSSVRHKPWSSGRYKLAQQRPEKACRKFRLPEVEKTIEEVKGFIKDPDMARMFENCFPNTLDTAVRWRGVADGDNEEELTYIITGDINAMWLRDSANQLQSYKSLLKANTSRYSLASLFRGAINLQARYIRRSPHCNAFRAPREVGLFPSEGGSGGGFTDYVKPMPARGFVWECKWELDSLAAFLQLSHEYYAGTGDLAFFGARGWADAVEAVLRVTTELLAGTYGEDGAVVPPPYKFQRQTSVSTETLANAGDGSPVRAGTGLVRSAFRPSDDATTYQLLVPANMMFSRYLASCAGIMGRLADLEDGEGRGEGQGEGDEVAGEGRRRGSSKRRRRFKALALRMSDFAESVRAGIERHARVKHPVYGEVYAYEIDGSGSHNLMDDANLPSLLSSAMMGYVKRTDPVYRNTRSFVLSKDNPYFMHGPVLNGTGGPHIGPGMAWPMSLVVRIMTTDDDDEIVASLRQLVSSTDGLGLMHESVNTFNADIFTRPWFSWANGLFGQMVLDLKERKPHILKTSFQ